jgi:hypothetical protein
MSAYNRYSSINTINGILPFVKIPMQPTDQYIQYQTDITRLDKVSLKYYDDVNYWWLIMLANPDYTSEFQIEDGAFIRIPFPLETAYEYYAREIELQKKL